MSRYVVRDLTFLFPIWLYVFSFEDEGFKEWWSNFVRSATGTDSLTCEKKMLSMMLLLSFFSSFFLTVCIPSHSLWMGDCNLRNVLFISLGSLRFRLGILSLSSLSKPQMHTFLYEEKYLSTIGSQDRGRRREKRWLPRDCGRHKTHTHTAILRSLAPFCATRGLHQNTCALHSYNVASIRERRGR